MYLYLDSTQHVICGLMNREDDSSCSWLDYKEVKNKKGSTLLHGLTHELLNSHGYTLEHIKGLILASGPGSYTGMRLAEGFAQILEWRKTPVFSFYHFEVPKFLGHEKGVWISSAFKGEYFSYVWPKESGKEESENLLSREDFKIWLEKQVSIYGEDHIFCHVQETFEDFPIVPKSTFEMIKNSPQGLFPKIIDRNKRLTPFYYRPLEREFKVPRQ